MRLEPIDTPSYGHIGTSGWRGSRIAADCPIVYFIVLLLVMFCSRGRGASAICSHTDGSVAFRAPSLLRHQLWGMLHIRGLILRHE